MNIDIPLLLSVIASIVAVGGYFVNRKTAKADVESIYIKMNTEQAEKIDELVKKNEEQAAEIFSLKATIEEIKYAQKGLQRALNERDEYIIVLLDGNTKLSNQLRSVDQKPCWDPPKPDFLYKINGTRTNGATTK